MKWAGTLAAAGLPGAALAESALTGTESAAKLRTPLPPGPSYSIAAFGAVGDGTTLATRAIQKAVDTCAAAGGGQIVIPPGSFLTGPIFLKSNLEINVQAGARLLFTTDFETVDVIDGIWEGLEAKVYASMLTGFNLENVSIGGHGVLDGQGKAWWDAFGVVRKLRLDAGIDGQRGVPNPPGSPLKYGRPRLINLYGCKDVFIGGIKLVNSPAWNIHPVRCENLVIDGVTILAPADSPNTDGIDPDSCRNVRISNCYIGVGDDCVIVKSGYAFNPQGVPCENIAVTNCVFGTGHCGVGIGSETAGGVTNVVATNCICDGTAAGLRIKTARGRGRAVENFRASNWVMRNVAEPVVTTMFYGSGSNPRGAGRHDAQPVSERTPVIRNIHLSDLVAVGCRRAGVIEGLPESPIEGFTLSNYFADAAGEGIGCTNVNHAVFDNVVVNAAAGPALSADTVRELELYRVTSRKPVKNEPVLRLEAVQSGVVQSCAAAEGTGTFLEIKGPANRDLHLFANRTARAAKEVEFTGGAAEGCVVKGG
jgi:polygalacturonase